MQRWNYKLSGFEDNPKVDAFLEEIWTVCEKHGMGLAHEDTQGEFEVVALAAEVEALKAVLRRRQTAPSGPVVLALWTGRYQMDIEPISDNKG